jgi:hypothetical protein
MLTASLTCPILTGYMLQLSSAVNDELPRRSRWWPVSFYPSLYTSALTLERRDGDASGFFFDPSNAQDQKRGASFAKPVTSAPVFRILML